MAITSCISFMASEMVDLKCNSTFWNTPLFLASKFSNPEGNRNILERVQEAT